MKQMRTSFNMIGVIALLALAVGGTTTNTNTDFAIRCRLQTVLR